MKRPVELSRKAALAAAFTFFAAAPVAGATAGCSHAYTQSPALAGAEAETATKVRAALAGPQRPDTERARDVYRHPLETLSFFGLTDDMSVVEISPGAGWYTAVLAPVLAEKGQLFEIVGDVNGDPKSYSTKQARSYVDRLEANADVYRKVGFVVFNEAKISFGPDDSVDMVLTFRNIHNWIDGDVADAIFQAAYRVLKPGGVFGVVEHRGKPGMTIDQIKKSGYVPVDVVEGYAKSAGFVVAGESEINANPKDTKDYSEGVWTLPPSYALGDKDHDKYAAIGESDRMTIRFQKPPSP